ncbi:uncharacterized protein [Elaeis guineensis]|uniref:uncharacterized protein n=1 Tax=Elaeis guineensis var. tenera TaxID=51953 RepID=UPI003C6DA66E
MTHTHQDGTFVRDESRDLYERATSLIAERDDESAASTQQSRIEVEVFTELMGPERYGRVRGYGVGVTPTQLSEVSRYTQHAAADAQDSRVRRLETEIQEIRQSRTAEMEEMRQSRAEMQAMRGQIDRLTSLLEMYDPSQPPSRHQQKSLRNLQWFSLKRNFHSPLECLQAHVCIEIPKLQ